MNNEALVSVIVPIYMVQDYLDKCVKSIRNQSYTNLEIILVDDGSKDDCGKMCDEYAKEDERIKVIHKINGGLSDARNAGIEVAKGKYFVFVDSDDYIHPQMIELLIKPVQDGLADMSVCEFVNVKEDQDAPITNIENPNTIIIESLADKRQYFLCETFVRFTVAWNKLYPREYFANVRYPKGKIHEDEFTTYKILEQAEKVAYITEPLYFYVQRGSSIMGEGFNKKTLDRYEALDQRIRYYAEQGNYDWAEKVHSIYRMMFLHDTRKIIKSDEFDEAVLASALKQFKDTTLKYVMKYPISLQHKMGYLFMAIFPKMYLGKRV
jgi:glycosyltransferase involved in cell wall biosynthesis